VQVKKMTEDKGKLISLICPVHNEEAAIPIFLKRLHDSILPLKNQYAFELIFVNDGSTDRTMKLIKEECGRNEIVQLITFSRNFGYHPAVFSGLQHASGVAIIIIAVDCEDPPELIPSFIAAWEQGHDIVYGIRGNRPEPLLINFGRRLFYRLSSLIADNDFVPYMGEYAVITDRVRDVIIANRSTFITIRSDIAYAGFSRLALPYKSQPRISGKTHYNLWGMIKLAISNILTSSTFPLRMSVYAGVPLLLLNWLVMAIGLTIGKSPLPVWLIALNLNFLVMVAIFIAVYLARVYKDGMNKPKFIIDWDNTELQAGMSTTEFRSSEGEN
jgi:polyisoprenyl-phosphate glycosyltransferase